MVGVGEMGQWGGILTVVQENLGSVPSHPHPRAAHSHL